MRLPLATQSATGRSRPLTLERLVNLYVEEAPGSAKAPLVLHSTPGLVSFATVGDGPIRGLHRMSGSLYAVSGNTVYKIAADGTGTARGIVAGTGPVSMADNGTQLVIVGGNKGFVYTDNKGVLPITDPDFLGAGSVDYLNGRFLFNNPNTGQFFISALTDATQYDALEIATAESHPDALNKILVDHEQAWLFGESSVEPWADTGAQDFPYSRISGAIIQDYGTLSPHTVVSFDNSVAWLDSFGVVRRADGYNPARISTHAIEHQISQGSLPDASAFVYRQEGHEFYVLTMPDVGTFVYDAATRLWAERQSYDLDRWRVSCSCIAYAKTLVGDYANGNIYSLSLDTFTEAGEHLVAELIPPPLQADGRQFIVHSLQLDMETGIGLNSGQGSDPQVMFDWTRDGKTWHITETWRSAGKQGEHQYRVLWWKLGNHRLWSPRIRISDPIKRAIYAIYVDVTEGES